MRFVILISIVFSLCACTPKVDQEEKVVVSKPSFTWENATVYFLLTDRFYNGDPSNDLVLGRKQDGALLRGFMGGDLKGISQKIQEGYFDKLGVTAIWLTPVIEQIHSSTDEGTGKTYGYHGYWARDWTALDPNFGSPDDLRAMVDSAHTHGIRVLFDAVINHTGPVTPEDSQWPTNWVRTTPQCDYKSYTSTIECTLVKNLPDIRTESKEEVGLPDFLQAKWQTEGRLEQETQQLNAFFARTGLKRTPRNYLIKWLSDWVREYGIDGFRVDTAKHVDEESWEELRKEVELALKEWKQKNPAKKPDDLDFFMVGEVYGYGIQGGRNYDFGDKQVDYFSKGFDALINFSFKGDANKDWDAFFSEYSNALNGGPLEGKTVLNYLSSHDDGGPYDKERTKSREAATRLLLSPGAAQIFYGDELARPLVAPGAQGDAILRSFMNWEAQQTDAGAQLFEHWSKLGQFRREHPSIGAGVHRSILESPYIFARTMPGDTVLVALNLTSGQPVEIPVGTYFSEGDQVKEYYSGVNATVQQGKIRLETPGELVLIGK